MTELVITTPEHVPIRLEPAGAGSRFLAILIDSLITTAVGSGVGMIASVFLPYGFALAVFITVSFVLSWGWHVWFETQRNGRTPGKKALSLRVVDARGLPVSLHQSLVRNIVRAIDFAPAFYGFGSIATLLDPYRRRMGDMVADTLVIRDAQPLAYNAKLGAERRHNSLRTPRVMRLLRHRISLEEREFLLTLCMRAEKLSPAARFDLMEDVARVYRKKLGIDEEQMSGENLVRDLTAALFNPREGSASPRRRDAVA
ncbi:MAG: RDD family protein [Acidobacteria bacterium]|nr:RDD family protein [Acidobacteriota bacterium]